MQIVIDIPKQTYNFIMNRLYMPVDEDLIVEAVRNGTPLPKGHGRLIDADELDTSVLQAGFAYAMTRSKLRYTAGDVRQKIANAPTIIEADTVESEEV